MRWLTADIVFDGYEFHADYYLQVDDTGMICQTSRKKIPCDIKKYKGLLMPGMINAHCHLELSHYKGAIEEKNGLSTFLQDVNALNQNKTEETEIQQAIKKADAQMKQNGIVAVGDICNTANTIQVKRDSSIHYHNFVECIAIQEKDVARRFTEYESVYKRFKDEFETSYALHAPYTCHEELYKLVNQHSDFISIHNQESEAENLLFQREMGDFDKFYEYFGIDKSEIIKVDTEDNSLLNSMRLLDQSKKLLFVHNTYAQEGEIDSASVINSWFCFCPKANLFIEDKLPDVLMFLSKENKIVLGTDSLASNDCLNILSEAKTIQDYFPEIPLNKILQWATSNGAHLFDLENNFGSFEKGKSPGFVNIQDFDVSNRKLRSVSCELV